jgi:Dicarboxylate transport
MRARRIATWFLGIVLLLVLAVAFVPWKPYAEKKLVAMLAAKGFAPVQLTIDHVGWRGVVLKDVTLGEPALKLATLTLTYQPRALLEGRIEEAEVAGLSLRATQGDAGWNIEGLQDTSHKTPAAEPVTLPVTKAALAALPLRSLRVRESAISVAGKGFEATLPLSIAMQHGDGATVTMESRAPTLTMGENHVAIGRISLELVMDATKPQWNGTWVMEDIALTSEALVLPVLRATGTIIVFADNVTLKGVATSKDGSHKAEFSLSYSLANPALSYVALSRLSMPFTGGRLATRDVKFMLDGKKRDVKFNLALSEIDVNALMQTLTSNRATGSGVVSGMVPVALTAGGQIRIGKGMLKAQAPGQIALAPEVIPGDNAQVALVREVMKNLQYTMLALEFGMAADNTLSAKLAVAGKNPDVEGGRPVKLTINLSGDLLDLILQNVMLMTDPKSFIEQ